MILLVPPHDERLRMPDGEFALGACNGEAKMICINEELTCGEFEQVLCHELVHASMFAYNIELSFNEEELLAEIISIFGEEIVDITDIMFDKIKRGRC